MESQLPEVKRGEPIRADLFNALVRRVNQKEQRLDPNLPAKGKGEFWIRNGYTETLPAFSCLRINGFYSPLSSVAEAKTLVANDRIILDCNKFGAGTKFAYALEGIAAGHIGRACFTQGPLLFAYIEEESSSGTVETVAINDTVDCVVAGSDSGKFKKNIYDAGAFHIVAFDSTTRFAALACVHAPITYGEGTGIDIDSSRNIGIDDSVKVRWGCYKSGTGYQGDETILTDSGIHIKFGSQFKRSTSTDDSGDYYIEINTAGSTEVVTGVTLNFSTQNVVTRVDFGTYSYDLTEIRIPNSVSLTTAHINTL